MCITSIPCLLALAVEKAAIKSTTDVVRPNILQTQPKCCKCFRICFDRRYRRDAPETMNQDVHDHQVMPDVA